MNRLSLVALAAVALLSTGCVTKQTHEATLKELDKTRQALHSAEETIHDQQIQIEHNREEIERGNAELSELETKKATLQDELRRLQGLLEMSQSELYDSKTQLETMRKIKEETQKRNEIYAQFVKALQKMIDGGRLTVSIEHGRLVLNLPENVLFATGSARINAEGQSVLKEIAGLLATLPDRRFQVEGYTDTVPIHNARFESNWELSAGRALSVVHLMIAEGVAPANLSAAGYGEYHPRASNDTEEGKALNRRIEIVMLPNLEILSDELPKIER